MRLCVFLHKHPNDKFACDVFAPSDSTERGRCRASAELLVLRRIVMRSKSLFLGLSIATFAATMSVPASRALGIGASASNAALENTYTGLPMSFEKNAGQSGSEVDFIARGSGYSVFLSSGEAVLAVKKQTRGATLRIRGAPGGRSHSPCDVRPDRRLEPVGRRQPERPR